jgi:hypothetical protein
MLHGSRGMCNTQSARRKANTLFTLCTKRHAPCAFPLAAQGCVKVARNVRFSGRHGDLPLRKHVGATLCGRPYL